METRGSYCEFTVLDTDAFELAEVFPNEMYRVVRGPGRQFELTESELTSFHCIAAGCCSMAIIKAVVYTVP